MSGSGHKNDTDTPLRYLRKHLRITVIVTRCVILRMELRHNGQSCRVLAHFIKQSEQKCCLQQGVCMMLLFVIA